MLTVTPVVAILPEQHKFEPRPNAGEVDSIFDVPLEMFLKANALLKTLNSYLGVSNLAIPASRFANLVLN